MADDDGLDNDDLDFLNESATFLVPSTSTLSILRNASTSDSIDTKNFIHYLHDKLCQNECKHFEKRFQSFELFRLQEECKRFHKESTEKESQDALRFSSDILQEITNSAVATTTTTTTSSSDISKSNHKSKQVIKNFIQNYLSNYAHAKSINQNFTFPWPMYDDDVQISCLRVLQQQDFNSLRAYLLGYFEVICRLPIIDQSTQGHIFNSSAAWALGRHPFGAYFTILLLGIKSIVRRIQLELLSIDTFCLELNRIIDNTANGWVTIWSKLDEAVKDTFLKLVFIEIVKECLQHVIFMSDSSFFQILCKFSHNVKEISSFDSVVVHSSISLAVACEDEVNEKSISTSSSYTSAEGGGAVTEAALRNTPTATTAVASSICITGFDDDTAPHTSVNSDEEGVSPEARAVIVAYSSSSSSSSACLMAEAATETIGNPIFLSSSSSSSSINKRNNHSIDNTNNNNYNDSIKSFQDLLSLENQCNVPISHRCINNHMDNINNDNSNNTLNINKNINTISNPSSMSQSQSLQQSAYYSWPSYMTAVHREMSVLLTARTPGEVASVAISIMDAIITHNNNASYVDNSTINSAAATNGGLRTQSKLLLKSATSIDTTSNKVLKHSTVSLSSSSSVFSENDSIGIISFCFITYLHQDHHDTKDEMDHKEKMMKKNQKVMMMMMMMDILCLADRFLLPHLRHKREGISVTICYTALNRVIQLLAL